MLKKILLITTISTLSLLFTNGIIFAEDEGNIFGNIPADTGDQGSTTPQTDFGAGEQGSAPLPPQTDFGASDQGSIPPQTDFGAGEQGSAPLPPQTDFGASDQGSIPPQTDFGAGDQGSTTPQTDFGAGEQGSTPPQTDFGGDITNTVNTDTDTSDKSKLKKITDGTKTMYIDSQSSCTYQGKKLNPDEVGPKYFLEHCMCDDNGEKTVITSQIIGKDCKGSTPATTSITPKPTLTPVPTPKPAPTPKPTPAPIKETKMFGSAPINESTNVNTEYVKDTVHKVKVGVETIYIMMMLGISGLFYIGMRYSYLKK